jgi:hypothetical protein
MGNSMPIGQAIGIDAGVAYGLVVVAALLLPETKGRRIATVPAQTASSERSPTHV